MKHLFCFSTIKSAAGFQLSIPGTPGTDHDEDEEHVTLGMMGLQRGAVRGCSAESCEDPIGESAHKWSSRRRNAEAYQRISSIVSPN